MKRKVVKHGYATLTVSLPSIWVKKHGIKQGDEVEIALQRKSLIINPERKKSSKFVEIHIPTSEKFSPRDITRLYVLGYDEIKVTFQDKNVISLIEREISYLLGFEIVTVTENTCVIKNVAQGIEEQFENMLNRLLFILISMGEELEEGLKRSNYDKVKLTLTKEIECNKLSLFCRRMFNIQDYQGEKNPYILYTLITMIEATMDEFRFLAEFVLTHKPKIRKEIFTFFQYINKMNRSFYSLFKHFDQELFIQFRMERKMAEKNVEKFYKLGSSNIYVFNRLYTVQELVHHMTYF